MEVKRTKISAIKLAAYNPKQRMESKRLVNLQKSIEKHGLIYPVSITKAGRLIDGHRRVAVAKQLGWTEIPALIIESDEAPESIYADINACGEKMTGAQNLAVWMQQPDAVTDRAAAEYSRHEETFGKAILNSLVKNGMSVGPLRTVRAIALYVDAPDNGPLLKKTARWLIEHRCTRVVRSYIDMQQPANALLKAIETGKPLKPTYAAVD